MSLPKLEVPTYNLTLPSTGKVIKYRPFLVKEHKILLTMAEADVKEVTRIVKDLVDVCTFKKLDIESLPHFDIEFIFLQLRAKSIGEMVEVIINCECGNKIDASFNLDNLKVEKDKDHANKIMINDLYGIELNYPKFENAAELFVDANTDNVFKLVTSCIKGIYSRTDYWEAKDQSKEEIEEFLYSLTKEQFAKIEKFFLSSPRIVQEIETDCEKCGKHNVSRLEGLHNFFL